MRAKRSLSQNFLTDPNLRRKVVEELKACPEDAVLEIGAGHGELGSLLVDRVAALVLVEKDDGLVAGLESRFAGCAGVRVVHGDALELDLASLVPTGRTYRVLSNLPYSITTPLLFRILECRPPPARVVVTVQIEVAERIVAASGTKVYGALSVGVQVRGTAHVAFRIRRMAFRPVPAVDSAVVVIEPAPKALPAEEELALRQLTRVAFGWRRKQLQKILRSAPEYRLRPEEVTEVAVAVGFDPRTRPETLDPATFLSLARALARVGRERGGDPSC